MLTRHPIPLILTLLIGGAQLACGQAAGPLPAAVEELVAFASGAPEIDEGLIDRILHVSPSGNDATADGTEALPFKSISAALARAGWLNQNLGEGVRVLVAAGTYLEGPAGANPAQYFPYPVNGKPIILEGEGWSPGTLTGDVVVTGAEPWGGWVDNGNGSWTAPWPYDFGEIDPATIGNPPSVPAAYPKREWLYVDGVTYFQFADAADPTLANRTDLEGAFWIDTTAQTITAIPPAGADFAGAAAAGTIQATTRIAAFHGWRSGSLVGIPAPVAIRNIRFVRFGEYALRFQNSNGLIIEDCEVLQCRHYGLQVIDSVGNTIRRVAVNDIGVVGLGHQADNALVEDFQLKRNGRQAMLNRFLGWGYGGMKIGNSAQVTYRRWEVRDSEGVGVWFDTGLVEVDFSDSVVTGSKAPAVFIENNNANTVADLGERTTLWLREVYIADSIGEPGATDGKGIQFAASENVHIEDCVIYNADWLLNFPSDSRGPQRAITLRRNVVASPTSQPLYYVAYGTNGWRESGDFDGVEGAFDTMSATTNDNAYFRSATLGFRDRNLSVVNFANWKQAHLDNSFNPNADRAVDSRSTFATGGYAGQPLVVARPVATLRGEGEGTVDGFLLSRVADDTAADLEVAYAVGGSAVAGIHYAALLGTAIIPAGSRSVLVPLTLLDNGPGDPDHTVTLQPLASANYLSLGGAAVVTITDNPVVYADITAEAHAAAVWNGPEPHLEFLLRRDTAATYPAHWIEASGTLQPASWTVIWNSDGTTGTENLIETIPLDGGREELRIRDPQPLAPGAPRFLRLGSE